MALLRNLLVLFTCVALVFSVFSIMGCESGLQDRLTSTESELSTVKGELSVVEGELTTVKGELSVVEGELTTVKGELSVVEGELTTVRGELSVVRGELSVVEGELSVVEGELSVVEGELVWTQAALELCETTGHGILQVENDYIASVTKLYISSVEDNEWGDQWLGAPIPSGTWRHFGVYAGEYDIKAVFSNDSPDLITKRTILPGQIITLQIITLE